jgi:hypothetical protein
MRRRETRTAEHVGCGHPDKFVDQVAVYACLVALAVADGPIEKDEVSAIFETLDTDGMSEAAKTRIHSFLIEPPRFGENLEVLAGGSLELRYGVMILLTEVALSDGDFTEVEKALLEQARSKLSITTEQLAAIETFVREGQRIRGRGIDDNVAADAWKRLVAGLIAVGVPIAAAYFSRTVIRLSAAGIRSGLAALGLRLGMVPGIGVAILIGTGVYLTACWLLDQKRKPPQESERRAQSVIGNLLEAINLLIARASALQEEASRAAANEEAIRVLTEALKARQQLLARRKLEVAV